MLYWDYSSLHGEETWKKKWDYGYHQSPVNIITEDTVKEENIDELTFNNDKVTLILRNKGVNVSISPSSFDENNNIVENTDCSLSISGGPLKTQYFFKECHFHWGEQFRKGSEHEVDGTKYDAELHLVHFKRTDHPSFCDALKDRSGLCVVSIFIEGKDNTVTNLAIKDILNMTKHVPYKGDQYSSKKELNLYDIIKDRYMEYYTYDGSLTTPPLSECVRWIVLKEPLYVSTDDLKNLYQINADSETEVQETFHDPFQRNDNCACSNIPKIRNNFRKCCSLNDRVVHHVR